MFEKKNNGDKQRFINPHQPIIRRNLWDLILWMSGYYDEPNAFKPRPSSFVYPQPASAFNPELSAATWINHSTFLIELKAEPPFPSGPRMPE
ncbi:MAG: hypothetical protein ACM3JI_02810, partial [Anaerolineae bacterium]